MPTPSRFEDLLPNAIDPAKNLIRSKLIQILNSQGEILPAARNPLGKLWNLVNSAESSIDECEEVILLDAALTSRIFRVANSAAFGAKATNVSEAIRYIGFQRVREMVYNQGVFEQFACLHVPPHWEMFWLRNILTARLCEKFARNYFYTDGSEYLAGLIHDIGWLFIATHFPEEFTLLFHSKKMVEQAEREILPFSHAHIASAIAARSSLPLRAVDAILYHPRPIMTAVAALKAPNKSPLFLAVILNVCDKIADCCDMDLFGKTHGTVDEIQKCPEVAWLNNFGDDLSIEDLIEDELPKSKEIFKVFFSEDPAHSHGDASHQPPGKA